MVDTTNVNDIYPGNSSATVLPITFDFLNNAQLEVIYTLISTGAVLSFIEGVDFTFAGGNPAGSVNLTVAHDSLHQVEIRRNTAITQTDDLLPNTTYQTQNIERALDKVTMITQEVDYRAGNFIASPAAIAALIALIEAQIAGFVATTGDAKLTFKTGPDAGWVMANDGSIGSLTSGATNRANTDTLPLYTLLWNNISDTYAPVATGRGANAAADFAANKALSLTKALGRALCLAGSGSGLTTRVLGFNMGEEDHALTANENGLHTHIQPSHNHTQVAHTHTTRAGINVATGEASGRGLAGYDTFGSVIAANADGVPDITVATAVNNAATATNNNSGLGTAHNNMQPSTFLNMMIKL